MRFFFGIAEILLDQAHKFQHNIEPSSGTLLLASAQDSAPVLSQSPNWEDAPALGVTDHAVLVEDSNDFLCYVEQKVIQLLRREVISYGFKRKTEIHANMGLSWSVNKI